MSKNAIVSIEVRVILVQWPCNCVPAMECSHQSFTLLLSLGCFKSPKLLSQFSHRHCAWTRMKGKSLGLLCCSSHWNCCSVLGFQVSIKVTGSGSHSRASKQITAVCPKWAVMSWNGRHLRNFCTWLWSHCSCHVVLLDLPSS